MIGYMINFINEDMIAFMVKYCVNIMKMGK